MQTEDDPQQKPQNFPMRVWLPNDLHIFKYFLAHLSNPAQHLKISLIESLKRDLGISFVYLPRQPHTLTAGFYFPTKENYILQDSKCCCCCSRTGGGTSIIPPPPYDINIICQSSGRASRPVKVFPRVKLKDWHLSHRFFQISFSCSNFNWVTLNSPQLHTISPIKRGLKK